MKSILASAVVTVIKNSSEIAIRELIREKVRNVWKKKAKKTSA